MVDALPDSELKAAAKAFQLPTFDPRTDRQSLNGLARQERKDALTPPGIDIHRFSTLPPTLRGRLALDLRNDNYPLMVPAIRNALGLALTLTQVDKYYRPHLAYHRILIDRAREAGFDARMRGAVTDIIVRIEQRLTAQSPFSLAHVRPDESGRVPEEKRKMLDLLIQTVATRREIGQGRATQLADWIVSQASALAEIPQLGASVDLLDRFLAQLNPTNAQRARPILLDWMRRVEGPAVTDIFSDPVADALVNAPTQASFLAQVSATLGRALTRIEEASFRAFHESATGRTA